MLGLQQIAIGGLDKAPLAALWQGQFGLTKVGEFASEKENVDEVRSGGVVVPVPLPPSTCRHLVAPASSYLSPISYPMQPSCGYCTLSGEGWWGDIKLRRSALHHKWAMYIDVLVW